MKIPYNLLAIDYQEVVKLWHRASEGAFVASSNLVVSTTKDTAIVYFMHFNLFCRSSRIITYCQ